MRIGANSGSLPKHLARAGPGGHGGGARRGGAGAGAPARELGLLRLQDLREVELGADDDPRLPDALGAGALSAPPRRHRGRATRAAARSRAPSASGALLMDGIGDTVRISLTADPVEEVKVAWEILKALGLRERGPMMIACPSCGRDNVGVWNLAEAVEERLREYPAGVRGRRHGLRGERAGRGRRRRLRDRGRARHRLHLRARARAQEGRVRHRSSTSSSARSTSGSRAAWSGRSA